MRTHSFEKDFYEIRALLTLQVFFGNEYGNLIRSESPDLITSNSELGVEITRAIDEQSKKEDVFFNKEICNHSKAEIDPEKIKSFQKSGKQVFFHKFGGEQIACGFSYAEWETNELMIETILHKIKLINNGKYQSLKHIDLYVFSDSFDKYEDTDIDEIIEEVLSVQNTYEQRFRYIYLDDVNSLIMIDLPNHNYKRFDLRYIIQNLCKQAKEEAERE